MRRFFVGLAVAAVLLVGCGGGGDTSELEERIAAMEERLGVATVVDKAIEWSTPNRREWSPANRSVWDDVDAETDQESAAFRSGEGFTRLRARLLVLAPNIDPFWVTVTLDCWDAVGVGDPWPAAVQACR